MMEETTLHDEESVKKMGEITFCVILGYLTQAEKELDDGIAKNKIHDAQEALFDWYEYGEEVSFD